MLDEHVTSALSEVKKLQKRRKIRRVAGAIAASTLGAIIGAHWYFGCTTKDLEHEVDTYTARVFEKETPVSLVDCQGKNHTISIIGEFPKGYEQQLKGVVATLPTKIVESTYTIRFVDTDKLKDGTSAHAHLLYNGGNLCIDKDASADTWVHELTHHAFFSIPISDQMAFASINEDFYRLQLIPFRDYPDRWAQRKDLPAGESGPAFGFPSRYAAKHPYECASEMMEEIWRLTHPKLYNPNSRKSTYEVIFPNFKSHSIQDHKQRYEFLLSHGFLSDSMKQKMEDGFSGKLVFEPSTD
jgi:hypothetical protein